MKSIKRLAVMVAVILVVLCLSALVSCDGNTDDSTNPTTNSTTTPSTNSNNSGDNSTNSTNDDNGNTDKENPNMVTVKVVDQNGKGIKGANIQICQGETCFFKPIITGANGVGEREYELNGERLKAKINSIDGMEDYLTPGTTGYVYFNSGERELTIVVKKVTIEVFDQDGKGIEAAKIKLSQGDEAFLEELITDADGIASGFIASNGEEISAVVTEILSGGNYKLSNEATMFGIGVYQGTITVNKLSAYTVKLTTMFGTGIKDAKVELFDVEKNRKQKTAYTDENGLVKFENVTPGEYYVKVSHESPSYVITTESVDGKYMFGNSTSLILEVIDLPAIQYSVTLSDKAAGLTVLLLDKDNEIVWESTTDENGTAYLTASNGDYVAVVASNDGTYYSPVYFEYNKTASGTSTKSDAKAGSSEETPILLYSNEVEYSFASNEVVWFKILNAHKKSIVINSTFSYYSVLYNSGDSMLCSNYGAGTTTTALDNTDCGILECLRIAANEAGTASIYVIAPGTLSSPIDVTDSVNNTENSYVEENVPFDAYAITYYIYTANKNTVLSVAANGLSVLFNGENGIVDGERHLYPVNDGDSVIISIINDEENDVSKDITFSAGEEKTDYSVIVYADGSEAEGIVVILYKTTEDGLVEIARGTTLGNGEYIFEDIAYASNYVIKVEYPDGYTFAAEEEVYLGTSNVGYYYLGIIKTGAVDLPFDYDTINGQETASVPENGVVWYSVYVRPGTDTTFKLVANSENAVIVVYYSDTNDDGVVDMNDEPVGRSTVKNGVAEYSFATNNRLYKVAIMTLDTKAEEIELVYSQKTAGEGETPDMAIEITEPTTETVTVNGTVYYRYTGKTGKLTIAVSEGAKLQRVILSLDNDPVLEDVENNTIVIDDTQGDWIYFAITGEGEATLTVTVE